MKQNRITSVPIPERMAHLPRDRRGYPIPVIVAYDRAGLPLFAINDGRKGDHCAAEGLCSICGGKLETGDMWFVGGPLSALHPHGAYMDGPMHEECSTYAMQVCPYLAIPNYSKRIDDRQAIKNGIVAAVLLDATQIPDRPLAFLQCRAVSFSMGYPRIPGVQRFHPVSGFPTPDNPNRWLDIRVWENGRLVTDEDEQNALVRRAVDAAVAAAKEHLGA